MEKEIKVGKSVFKIYDFFVFLLIVVGAILIAALNGALQLNLDSWLVAIIIVGAEVAYIFGVVNKRSKK